jgi:putative lipase involved disintegration of autophagic bodies
MRIAFGSLALFLLSSLSAPAHGAPSVAELARLAAEAYRVSDAQWAPPEGFALLHLAKRDPGHGFQAAAFVKKATGEVIVSFCGTKKDALDIAAGKAIAKIALLSGRLNVFHKAVEWLKKAAYKLDPKRDDFTYQVLAAKIRAAHEFLDESLARAKSQVEGFQPSKIFLTGHSLGGFLAQLVGAARAVVTHTFNAAGGAKWIAGKAAKAQTVTNHRRTWDLVSGAIGMASSHLGKVCEYGSARRVSFGLRKFDQLGAHSIDLFAEELRKGLKLKGCK